MRIGSAWSSGVEGISRATANFEAAAAQTYDATVPTDSVSIGGGGDDLIAATTGQMQASVLLKANVKLLQSSQQMDDVLLQLLTR
ncbi:MAG: hypothetical protein U0228_10240 [Myxococcaceae bacterium]